MAGPRQGQLTPPAKGIKCGINYGNGKRGLAAKLLKNLFFFCSDGAGRSGVYIAIDANIELSEEDGVFDVFGYLKKIRQQRRGLIETLVRQNNPCFPSQCWLSL